MAVVERVHLTPVEVAVVSGAQQQTREEPTDTVAMVCDAICRLFVRDPADVDPWLDAAAEQLLRIARVEPTGAECTGAWVALVEVNQSGVAIATSTGTSSLEGDEIRSDIRNVIQNELASPTFHSGLAHARDRMRAARPAGGSANTRASEHSAADSQAQRLKIAHALEVPPERSVQLTHFPVDPSSLRLGSLCSLIDDGFHGTPLLCAGFHFSGGEEQRRLSKSPIVVSIFDAIARISTRLIVRPRAAQRAFASRFSLAQQQVFHLLIRGLTESEIGVRLGRSHHTIHDHVRGMYKTLGVSSKTELIAKWHSAGAV